MQSSVTVRSSSVPINYDVRIGGGSLQGCGRWALDTLGPGTRRVAVVSDLAVAKLYDKTVQRSLIDAGFETSLHMLQGGERRKDLTAVRKLLAFLARSDITRTDCVLALGGGVVGDIAGFAAAIHLRGVKFLNVPTTLLAMIDASVGGKTGVNSPLGKNTLGAFYPPAGVLADPDVLATLPRREITAGLYEAVKHGAISGRLMLNNVRRFSANYPAGAFAGLAGDADFRSAATELVQSHVKYKASIVAGDERESAERTDASSRKVLNFGHMLAHALEAITNYTYFKHGEAVGYGILFAANISKNLAICPEKDVELLNDVVHRLGKLPSLAGIDDREVLEAFRSDKKNLSGSLQMVLLSGIGKPVIVPFEDIPTTAVRRALKELRS